MLPDRVSYPGPLTYESGALPIALRGPAVKFIKVSVFSVFKSTDSGINKQTRQSYNTEVAA